MNNDDCVYDYSPHVGLTSLLHQRTIHTYICVFQKRWQNPVHFFPSVTINILEPTYDPWWLAHRHHHKMMPTPSKSRKYIISLGERAPVSRVLSAPVSGSLSPIIQSATIHWHLPKGEMSQLWDLIVQHSGETHHTNSVMHWNLKYNHDKIRGTYCGRWHLLSTKGMDHPPERT